MALTNKVKPKNSENRGKKQLKELKFCNYYKKQGYIDNNCWTKYLEKSPNTLKNTRKSDDEKSEVLTVIKPELAKILTKKTELVNITSKNDSYKWILDSGASIHICYEKSLFSTLYKTDRTVL
jgi:predicted DNA binding protein